ncbi:formylglycine-generating enzyme family protein [bacterium]|nr:formylglycine-generating enzyme family protein [bacterium]
MRRPLPLAMALLALSALPLGAAPTVHTGWPFDSAEAKRRQAETARALGCATERTLDLPGGGQLTLVLIPAGEFTMGAPPGEPHPDPDEVPAFKVIVSRPLWVSQCEITNGQFRLFRPDHDSRAIDTHWKDRVGPGPSLNGDQQPAVRLSWFAARDFCLWLGKTTGLNCRLPDETEWEYACRAGTDTPWVCAPGELARVANFADASLRSLKPWALRDDTQNDRAAASADVGRYEPNAWGLRDMHGNVAEWCGSDYGPYPLAEKRSASESAPKAVRGGSWDDRLRRVRSAFRQSYAPDYAVYNVGFRVVCDVEGK